MNDAVSHALVARGRDPRGFPNMVGLSLVVHAVLIALLLVAPSPVTQRMAEERDVMMISLGGAPGPRAGGMTPMGGRPVQQVMPTTQAPRPEPVRPPAARTPEMTTPSPRERPARQQPPQPVRTAPPDASGRTPTRGEQVTPGSAVAQTGGRGVGFGLSTGGGGTGGEINLGDFCCPEYLQTLLAQVQSNWNSKQQVVGVSTVRFTIVRDGSITNVQIARSSGFAVLDLTAQRAVMSARLPPLPAAYTNPDLTIHLTFEYQR
jgi:periplasmic protein TonB